MNNCLIALVSAFTLTFICFNIHDVSAQTGVSTPPPDGATVLFDGSEVMLHEKWTYWEGPRLQASLPIKWEIIPDPVDEGTVVSSNDPAAAGGLYGAADIITKEKFNDFHLHVEFLVGAEGGNSGVYLQNRYEIQILDGDEGIHGMAAIINEHLPQSNPYHGIGKWNAYDIRFRAARFKDGELNEKARVTIYFNGEKIHQDKEIQQVWGGPNSGLDGGNDEGKGITNQPGPIKLQAEGHDVFFRNIWIKPIRLTKAHTDF
ncbi:3-keto-disaccharide hydrolase [Pararhodonellum marinum]|uniref:3-keto-disaccharide hydrolase n=1 Tax=Pararhodonellum marinum TaxID=2755358 RepID=UPI00188F7D45|nr:DUF1080 domain-containing protein [Pararhodonellum marinum]